MSFWDRVKQIIKLFLAITLYYTGVISICRHFTMKNKAVILLYHRIVTNLDSNIDYSPDGMVVTGREFDNQMEYLSKNYKVVSLNQLIDYLEADEALPAKLCVLTFDDGWKEIKDHAYEVLKKYGLPATVFLIPNYMGGNDWFWEERLKYLMAYIFKLSQENKLLAKDPIAKKLERFELQDLLFLKRKNLSSYLMNLIHKCRIANPTWRISLIQELERSVNLASKIRQIPFLDWNEAREMSQNCIAFGAHTLTHCNLNMSIEGQASQEISDSKKILEEKLSVVINTFRILTASTT